MVAHHLTHVRFYLTVTMVTSNVIVIDYHGDGSTYSCRTLKLITVNIITACTVESLSNQDTIEPD